MPHRSLHITELGSSDHPPILFLHGFLGSGADWREIARRLSDSFRCLLVDLPGHGKTPPLDDACYTVPGCARAVTELLHAMAIPRTHVVGYSMGGRLTLYLALRHAGMCGRVVVESASPGLMREADRSARREQDERWARRFETEALAGTLETWYAQPLFSTLRARPDIYREVFERRLRNEPREVARALRGMSVAAQDALWDGLPELSRPLLAIAGEEDRKYRRLLEDMADLSPRIEIAMVPDAGHNAHAENPAEFTRVIRTFLTNQQ